MVKQNKFKLGEEVRVVWANQQRKAKIDNCWFDFSSQYPSFWYVFTFLDDSSKFTVCENELRHVIS